MYTHTHQNINQHLKRRQFLFATAWMDLEDIMLSEKKKNTVLYHLNARERIWSSGYHGFGEAKNGEMQVKGYKIADI
jgi:hypothetical protein